MAQTGDTSSRFASVGDAEISKLLADKDSASTKRTIRQAVNLFRDYLCQNGMDPAFENLPKEGLNLQLRNFFVAVRGKDGKMLKKSSLNCIRYGLTKFLKAEKDIDISADPEFQTTREVYLAVLVDMKKKGYGGVDHYPPIAPEDLQKLYNDDLAFNTSTPTGLQNKVWFEIMFYLCRRGRENLRTMTRDTFAVATDGIGRKYIYQKTDESDKNHKGATTTDDTVGESRIYEITGSSMCPVLSFEKYINKLNPKQEALWQRPANTFIDSDKVWYMDSPLGRNTLSGMMPKISSLANLSHKYTNHSIRASCITLLDQAGIEARHIMRTSGHRSEASIRSYSHRLSDNKKREISETLSSAVGVLAQKPALTPVSKVTGSSDLLPTIMQPELNLPGPSTSATPQNVVVDFNFENITPMGNDDVLSDDELLKILESLEESPPRDTSRTALAECSTNTSTFDLNVNSSQRHMMFTPNISNCNVTMNFNYYK